MRLVKEFALVILAGGLSTRMKKPVADESDIDRELVEQSRDRPKGMLGVGPGGRPFLDYLLYNARNGGIRDIVIVTGGDDRVFRDCFGRHDRNNAYHGLRVSYVMQRVPEGYAKPRGTADALQQALESRPEWKGRSFLVCNSDNLYSSRAFAELLRAPDTCAMIGYGINSLGFPMERILKFGIVRVSEQGYLEEIIEKPDEETLSRAQDRREKVLVSMNIWKLHRDMVLPYLESCPVHPHRQEKELPAAISSMLRDHPRAVKVIPFHERVPDLTNPADIERVRLFLSREYSEGLWQVT